MSKAQSKRLSSNIFALLNKGDYEESFPLLVGSNPRARFVTSSQVRSQDPVPKSGVSKSIIEDAWCVHSSLEVTLSDKAVGEKLAKMLRAEKKSLEADFKEFTSCPDSLIPKKLVDIEARTRRIKGLSPAFSSVLSDREERVLLTPVLGFSSPPHPALSSPKEIRGSAFEMLQESSDPVNAVNEVVSLVSEGNKNVGDIGAEEVVSMEGISYPGEVRFSVSGPVLNHNIKSDLSSSCDCNVDVDLKRRSDLAFKESQSGADANFELEDKKTKVEEALGDAAPPTALTGQTEVPVQGDGSLYKSRTWANIVDSNRGPKHIDGSSRLNQRSSE
ncbi:hypothetical protein U1Q18_025576, partial [Sarracenia purpurea var. burkii]